jgi:hypothetical protein
MTHKHLAFEVLALEITGDYSHQYCVEWKGGTLVTRNCTVGGFVNADGTPVHTVFHPYEGTWEATDTTVQYSYGPLSGSVTMFFADQP